MQWFDRSMLDFFSTCTKDSYDVDCYDTVTGDDPSAIQRFSVACIDYKKQKLFCLHARIVNGLATSGTLLLLHEKLRSFLSNLRDKFAR